MGVDKPYYFVGDWVTLVCRFPYHKGPYLIEKGYKLRLKKRNGRVVSYTIDPLTKSAMFPIYEFYE